MGEARRRGTFEERKAQAIERGDSKEKVRKRIASARQAGKVTAYETLMMQLMLANQGRSL